MSPVPPHQSVTPFYRDRARYLREAAETAQDLIDLLAFIQKQDQQEAGHTRDVSLILAEARALHGKITAEAEDTQKLADLEIRLASLAQQIYLPQPNGWEKSP